MPIPLLSSVIDYVPDRISRPIIYDSSGNARAYGIVSISRLQLLQGHGRAREPRSFKLHIRERFVNHNLAGEGSLWSASKAFGNILPRAGSLSLSHDTKHACSTQWNNERCINVRKPACVHLAGAVITAFLGKSRREKMFCRVITVASLLRLFRDCSPFRELTREVAES